MNVESMLDKQSHVLDNKIKILEAERATLSKQISKCHNKTYVKNLFIQIEENKTWIRDYSSTLKKL